MPKCCTYATPLASNGAAAICLGSHANASLVTSRDASASGGRPPAETAQDADSTASVPIDGALERLLARFESFARRVAGSRGLAPGEIDDVLQDVRIRLWRSQLSGAHIDRLSASYFLRVVSSAVIDHLRARRRRRELSIDAVTGTTTIPASLHVAPADHSEQEALAEHLGQALDRLVINRRLVVRLHLEGYERSEISEMTGWTDAKVRNLLYRGLEDLRAHLKGRPGTSR